jgi:glycogen debranching enzyme
METLNRRDIQLDREGLKGRTFLLGNKRAFSLSLPVAGGLSDTLLHPHKWFGAYLYGRKFYEGQLLRAHGSGEHLLNAVQQTGFTMTLTSARREYLIEGRQCSEEYFVPDGVQGFACTLTGNLEFSVEPEFDIRFYRALNHSTDAYEVEEIENGVLVSNVLPSGSYDDVTETFLPDDIPELEPLRLFAAVQVIGENTRVEMVPAKRRSRQKLFRKDSERHRFLTGSAPDDAKYDHAPLWNQSVSRVYAPVRLYTQGHGTIVYGFGASREEALERLNALRENLLAFQAQKSQGVAEILDRAHFETRSARVDTAYAQVLTRLMDALVARYAVAEDTALEGPATMILAGNQYFHDSWKRDENIALGFLLSLGFYDLARDVIRDTWQLQDDVTGRLPQRIRAGEDPPYHSSDGTLWALLRLYQYWRYSGDESLLYEKLPMVQLFFRRSLNRVVDGMLPSGRTHAPDYLWETWMDTPHTPRDGFPIEIQMLWIACLRVFRPILEVADAELERDMQRAELAAWQALQRFNVRGVPADSLDEQGEVRDLITPNPYFCFGVGLDLGPEVERAMRDVGRRQLAGKQGIITLAPQDWERVFSPEFLSDRRNVRGRRMQSIGKFNYHRGVEWNWLSQFFVQAELKYGDPDMAYRKYLRRQVDAVLDRAGVGGISELFDLSGTRGPEFQAWSMAGFLEALHAFAGVHIDVPEHRIVIDPQLPDAWPQLSVRKWFGSIPFDLRYTGDGTTRTVKVEFPWGEAPAATLEIGLMVPARRAVDFLDIRMDGIPQLPQCMLEPVVGTEASRLRVTVAARGTTEITLGLKRASARAAVPA